MVICNCSNCKNHISEDNSCTFGEHCELSYNGVCTNKDITGKSSESRGKENKWK